MTNVPATPEVAQTAARRLPELPGCGAPAAVRFEIYRTRDGVTYGELSGTVNVCEAHAEAAKTAATSEGFLPFRLRDDVSDRPCGSGIDFTGERPEALASRRREADPDFGRVRDVDLAHAAAIVIEVVSTATPAEVVMAAAAGQPALVRIFRAGMLREIRRMAYAVDQPALPAPLAVRFDPRSTAVQLDFDTQAEAEAWAERLGGLRSAQHWAMVGATGYHAIVDWRGARVDLVAVVPTAAEQAEAVPA
ncbi:hypothetical protein ABZ807_05630 [Micromonospora sp. NPDC047548]|uniref:hypothetical protein n=1 Tax=Micromonospora sp. NPDC047548 TaxID=3155624 RepID=UPI0033F973E2